MMIDSPLPLTVDDYSQFTFSVHRAAQKRIPRVSWRKHRRLLCQC